MENTKSEKNGKRLRIFSLVILMTSGALVMSIIFVGIHERIELMAGMHYRPVAVAKAREAGYLKPDGRGMVIHERLRGTHMVYWFMPSSVLTMGGDISITISIISGKVLKVERGA